MISAPAKRLQKLGHSNVLVDCFINALVEPIPEDTAGGIGTGRQSAVSKWLSWNIGRQSQKIRWTEAESRRMGYENLKRREQLIVDTVTKTREYLMMNKDRSHLLAKKFG